MDTMAFDDCQFLAYAIISPNKHLLYVYIHTWPRIRFNYDLHFNDFSFFFLSANPGVHTSHISKMMGHAWRSMPAEKQLPYK